MTNPILTPTEYDALCNVLRWAWTSVHQEPELCLKDINYSSASSGIDPIKTGECGLGLTDALECTLDDPNQRNVMTMIDNLMYKLNCNYDRPGNTWETLAPLVDNNECDRLFELSDDPNTPTQTMEGYVLEDIGKKDRIAQLQEHFDGINDDGMIEMGDGMMIDGINSDLTL